jgi:hypothetical protein
MSKFTFVRYDPECPLAPSESDACASGAASMGSRVGQFTMSESVSICLGDLFCPLAGGIFDPEKIRVGLTTVMQIMFHALQIGLAARKA